MKTRNGIAAFFVCLGLLSIGSGVGRAAGPPAPPPPDTNCFQLNGWSFAGTNWQSDAGYPPVAFTNIAAAAGGNGIALLVDSASPAFLRYNVVESDGTTNLTLNVGSVAIFFAPDWSSADAGGSGPGCGAPLVQVGEY